MASVMWASLFFVFTIIGAFLTSLAMMGMPIASELWTALIAMAVVLVVSGTLVPALSGGTARTG
ncbi:MAG: hypothetical protein SGJ03_07345 [Alphaproteobacteria bacterium]|nr:hypothetical protein [Alphaproteobacteria bacterium]